MTGIIKKHTATGVYDDLRLLTTGEKFFILSTNSPENVLVIDRVTEEIKLESVKVPLPANASESRIKGILGTIKLISCNYLVVVTDRVKVGENQNGSNVIWKVKKVDLLSYAKSTTHLSSDQNRLNNEYIMMFQNMVSSNDFYFSYTYDLSHSVQRLQHLSPEQLSSSMLRRGEQRFVWNAYLMSDLNAVEGTGRFLLPIINGFVGIEKCVVNGQAFTITLISRRSKLRAGLRLFTRGVDSQGNVANFVESEMIVETRNERASFVQTRGSMPFFWQQWPNLKYKPKPAIIPTENHLDAFNKHFEAQQIEYGRQVLVNLVDQKGSEGKLEQFYKDLCVQSGNTNIKYEAFDFHCECSKMRWERLSILIDRMSQDQEEMGYTLMINDEKVVSYQDGVFRTNCIDCLDRTNVVQSMIARRALTDILKKLNILKPGEAVKDHGGLEMAFRGVWTDNADAISVQYSGTGALKTDFTRTGIRSHTGMLQDLTRSALRYYRNNLCQGSIQDGLDLFLGNYRVASGEGITVPSPLDDVKDWKYNTFPLVLLVAIAMFFANLITPVEYETSTLLCLIFWGSMVAFTLSTIFYYGKDFVDYPRLATRYPSSITRA
ncbi:hypothetical protein GE061_017659 [Apolygus lucorum]|uniref:Phosphatidylinositol-3-phosphatase SAC1 n=1 Tax=Apolygus lucorum TaxID=248454 RepID=A0A8S9XE98_APOLU|nr:hypothetical protein GE061_017659 [Apolygus lucorum]